MNDEVPEALRNLTKAAILAGVRDGQFEVRRLDGTAWMFPASDRKPPASKGRNLRPTPKGTPRPAGSSKLPYSYLLRLKSYASQNAHCFYCNRRTDFDAWTTDHKTPISRGGTGDTENLVGCCSDCNQIKGPLTVEEFLAIRHDDALRKAKVIAVQDFLSGRAPSIRDGKR